MVYSLNLFDSVLAGGGTSHVANLTDDALRWRRSTRLQGGYWRGTFTLRGKLLEMQDFYYTKMGFHLQESVTNVNTWEGFIAIMDLDDDEDDPSVKVEVHGYIATGNNQYVSTSGSAANVSTWIADIISTDCQFLSAGAIDTNTLQVPQTMEIEKRAWEEILKSTEMGDASGNPWRFYVDNDRECFYNPISTMPRYFSKGTVIRRRSLFETWNKVSGTYIDDSNKGKALAAANNVPSQSEYGIREYHMLRHNIPDAAAAALRDSFLSEQAYPWSRGLGTKGGVKLFNLDSSEVVPWTVKPGVVRDTAFPVGGAESDAVFLTDDRDFLVDEVVVKESGEISLRSADFHEAELLEAQFKAMFAGRSSKPGKKKRRGKKNIGRFYEGNLP